MLIHSTDFRYSEILLFSGGVDSYIAYHFLKMPTIIYFYLGSRYSQKEMHFIPKLLKESCIILDDSLSFLGKMEEKNAHIPFRNLFLAVTSVAKYSDVVWIAGLKDDNVSDKNERVFKLWSDHLSELCGRTIQIKSPFWNLTKVDIVNWFANRYDANLLLSTVSCYSEDPYVKYCGRCQACFRKAVALYSVNIFLPFHEHSIIEYYKDRFNKGMYYKEREAHSKIYINRLEKEGL